MLKTIAFALTFLSASEALRCYQGQQNTSDPVQGRPLDCLANAVSCGTAFDIKEKIATRFCDTSNCAIDGAVASSPECASDLTFWLPTGGKAVYCCCYGDGCNNKSINENAEVVGNVHPDPEETNFAGSIASRIEDFYERDTASSERTFIRRVVRHIYKHINDDRKGKW